MPEGDPHDGGWQIEWLDVADDPSHGSYATSGLHTRRQFVVALIAAALALAGAGTWYVTRPVHKPALVVTLAGRTVDNATAVISHADAGLAQFARAHHGALSAHSRCYFNRVGGNTSTDVGDHLFCGPVLFHGGTPAAPYLRYGVSAGSDTTDAHLDAVAANIPDSPNPAALPPGAHLERPDRRSPPQGADGLLPPPPAPAPPNLLALATAGDVAALPAMPTTAVIGSRNIEVHLQASGQISSYGTGMQALSAPPGQTLHAFRLRLLPGEAAEPADEAPVLGVSIDGAAPRGIQPNLDPSSYSADGVVEVLVAAVPRPTRTVDLVVTDAGVTQRMSLLTGEPAPGNIRVLQRPYASRIAQLSPAVHVPATITGGGTTRTIRLTVELDTASLGYFAPYGSARAGGPTRALLSVAICLRSPDLIGQDNAAGACRTYDTAGFSVTSSGGQRAQARSYDNGFIAVDVPGSFTTGELTISGSENLGDGSTLTFDQPCTLRIAFSA